MKRFYFAYGSNLSLDQMRERCPNSAFMVIARLENYKFVYDGYSYNRKGAVANVVKSTGSVVRGAVFEVTDEDERRLDEYEGYHIGIYSKKELVVKGSDGQNYKVFLYLREPQKLGKPSRKYEELVVNSAKELGLPDRYIENYLSVSEKG